MPRLPQPLGTLLEYRSEQGEHHFVCENGRLRLSAYAPLTFRFRIDFGADPEPVSICAAVPETPLELHFEPSEGGFECALKSIRIAVGPQGHLGFYHPDGRAWWIDDPIGALEDQGRITLHKALQPGERFLGLGEKTGPLDKRGRQYQNWNTDRFAYHPEDDPLYASIPFYIGLHSGLCYGVWIDEPGLSTFNFGASNHRFASVRTENGHLVGWFFAGADLAEVVYQHSRVTGTSELPPLWALGYQQCRYSYYPASELLELSRQFRARRIPCDTLYLDIHYMDDYKVFSWHDKRFRPLSAWSQPLQEAGFKVVAILDPGLKREEGYAPFDEALEKNWVLTHYDGEPYWAEAWPGLCAFPDFVNPKARTWWSEWVARWLSESEGCIDGLWTDMNEPAVWGKSVPDTLISQTDQGPEAHRVNHNAYGYFMAQATWEGLQRFRPNKRPFVLSRAGYSGQQRIGALWTGDNSSGPDHLMLSARMMAGMGLSGVPFCGADVGGFIGEAQPELFGRWMQLGAFSPLFRGHSMIHSRDAEPWSFGEEVEEICRNAIGLRYRLLPLFYQGFDEHHRTGLPVLRSLAFEHPFEDAVYQPEFENQFAVGKALLVAPFAQARGYGKIWLPEGRWYDLYTDRIWEGGVHVLELKPNALPVFVRAGRGFPAQSVVQHTAERPQARELHLYWGEPGQFEVYEDAGEGYAYRVDDFLTFRVHWDETRFSLGEACGRRAPGRWTVFLHGLPESFSQANGMPIERRAYRWVEPLSNFDPYYRDVDLSLEIGHLARLSWDWDGQPVDWVLS
ncbi:DUF5110 domain-containing protein [bacterium]|nr:DUF5110 domain-containing protein [bacterium]